MEAAFAGFSAVSAVAGGLSGRAQAMDAAARADAEARLAGTQTLQRDTIARQDLAEYLGSVNAARAANGLTNDSPNARAIRRQAIQQFNRDRLVDKADGSQRVANLRAQAKGYRRQGRFSLFKGLVKGAVPIGEYGLNNGWAV